jgi:hypothetical protein
MTLLLDDAPVVTTESKNEPQDPDKVQHYFRKEEFDANLFEGTPMVALCGYVKTTPPKDIVGLDVCEKCLYIFENVVGTNLPKD